MSSTQVSIEFVRIWKVCLLYRPLAKTAKKRGTKVFIVTESRTNFLPKGYSERNRRTALFGRAVAAERTKN